ncbi:unnamed protein product [Chondrus crispus]|uniref:Uncharacterized protein n=1 Tax=Chondrus crispus TaxID=2769 RepID=R7QBU2_CHOCR|nr:unnamed protein product [Chondrus crispus]CDF35967.1 unnamed protein product [Chondrus crispus]|eukprot:XP_005715786.1 unnamed protein product [Chondrus crispus]
MPDNCPDGILGHLLAIEQDQFNGDSDVQSGLPSSLKSLLYEEQSRVRRLQRWNLRQRRMDSFCSR